MIFNVSKVLWKKHSNDLPRKKFTFGDKLGIHPPIWFILFLNQIAKRDCNADAHAFYV